MAEISVVHGVAFVVLGVALLVLRVQAETSRIAGHFAWLSAFGFLKAASAFSGGWSLTHGVATPWSGLLLLASYSFLFEFSRRAATDWAVARGVGWPRALSPLVYLPVLAGVALLTFLSADRPDALRAAGRYLVGFPATMAAAFFLPYALGTDGVQDLVAVRMSRTALVTLGLVSGLVTERVDDFPAWLPTHDWGVLAIGLPVQMVRALCGVVLACGVVMLASDRSRRIRLSERAATTQLREFASTLEKRVADEVARLGATEEALHENAARLAQVVSFSRIGIFDHDHRTDRIYLSPEIRDIHGWGPDSQEPVSLDVVHAADRDRVRAAIERARRPDGDGVFDIEYRIMRRDGSVRSVASRSLTTFEGEGHGRHAVRTVGALMDTTERRAVQDALRRSEARLHEATRIYDIGIFEHDHFTNRLYWSPEQRQLHGRGPDEPVTMPALFESIVPEDRQRVAAAFERSQDPAGDGRCDVMHRIARPDGTIRWVDNRSQTVFEGTGDSRRAVQTVGVTVDVTERVEAQARLTNSEEKYRALVESSRAAIVITDTEGRYVYGNPAAAAFAGTTVEQFVGTMPESYFPPEVAARMRADIRRVMATGQVVVASRHTTVNGRPVWFESSLQPSRDARGRITGVQIMSHDVTRLKLAEDAVRASEALLKQIVRLSHIGVFDHDHISDDIYWSSEHRDIYGWSRDEPMPFRRFEAIHPMHPDDSDRVRAAIRRAHESDDGLFDIEYRIVHRDGCVRWISSRAQTFFEGEGVSRRAVRTVGATVDITERVTVQEALRRSEERLREAVRVNSIGIFEHDHPTNVLYWSPEHRQLYGWGPDEPVTLQKIMASVGEDERDAIASAIDESHDPAGNGRFESEYWIARRDGTMRRLHTRAQTVFAGEGEARTAVRTVGAAVDITERKQLEDALRESLVEKETLLREVHHRVKNNLQVISSLLHFQAKKVRASEDLVVFQEARDRLGAMILVHEKLHQSTGLSRVNMESYLSDLVRDLTLSHAATTQRIDVSVVADELFLPIEAALPCGMIVCELLTNVFKYAFPDGRGGRAEVRVDKAGGGFVIRVTDDGVGLPPGFDVAHTSSFGMVLVTGLVRQLGGVLTIGADHGTRVAVTVPAPRAAS